MKSSTLQEESVAFDRENVFSIIDGVKKKSRTNSFKPKVGHAAFPLSYMRSENRIQERAGIVKLNVWDGHRCSAEKTHYHTREKLQEIEKTFDVSSDREHMVFGKVNIAVAVQKKSFCPSPLYLCRRNRSDQEKHAKEG